MSCSSNIVKAKCIDQRILKRLPESHHARDFVRASKESQREFYSGHDVVNKDQEKIQSKLTVEKKNMLAAKILRAEMMGDLALANRFKKEMRATDTPSMQNDHHSELSPEDKGSRNNIAESSANKETVLLTKTDFRSGLTYPVYKKHVNADSGRTNKRSKRSEEASDFSIKDMLELEKFTSAEDQLAMFGATSSKVTSQRTDDSFTVDDAIEEQAVKKKKHKARSDEQSDFNRAVLAHKRLEETLENCQYCIDSKKFRKHLIVAVGLKTYLAVPACKPLVNLQCCIVPMSHISSCVQMDEDVYEEMKIWRKGLVAMCKEQQLDIIFVESAKNVRFQPHGHVECYPIPFDVGSSAPMYFKKAILECEEEWAQNKKIIDLRKKELRKSVPRGFSYFAVDFGLQSGYAHAIENESKFGHNFGQEILGGMLDLDATLWLRPSKQTLEDQMSRVSELKSAWAPFDWTERVKQRLKNDDEMA